MRMSYLSDIDDRSLLTLLMHNTDNSSTCNWTELNRWYGQKEHGKDTNIYSILFFTIIMLSMTNCELMQIMRNALNAKQHIVKVTLDGRKLTPVISTFPFKHVPSVGLQFDGLRILLALEEKTEPPNLRCDSVQTDLFFRRWGNETNYHSGRYHYRGLERGAFLYI